MGHEGIAQVCPTPKILNPPFFETGASEFPEIPPNMAKNANSELACLPKWGSITPNKIFLSGPSAL